MPGFLSPGTLYLICLHKDSENSAYSCTHGYDLLQQQATEQNQPREKAHGVKSAGNEAQASKSPLPVESQRTC